MGVFIGFPCDGGTDVSLLHILFFFYLSFVSVFRPFKTIFMLKNMEGCPFLFGIDLFAHFELII